MRGIHRSPMGKLFHVLTLSRSKKFSKIVGIMTANVLWDWHGRSILIYRSLWNQSKLAGRQTSTTGKGLTYPTTKSSQINTYTWWRHYMETFSALLAICAGNSPVTGEFPAQRPVTQSFDVLFDLGLNEWLSKQSWGWWFETPLRLLWRHSNDTVKSANMYLLNLELVECLNKCISRHADLSISDKLW